MSLSSKQNLNKTLDYIHSSTTLSDWEKSQLYKVNSISGIQCLLRMWLDNRYEEEAQGSFCNATWDNVYCWPPTPLRTVTWKLCSDILREMHPTVSANLQGAARQECILNETTGEPESQTDYAECIKEYDIYLKQKTEDNFLVPMVQYMLFIGSILSLICLSASLLVFYKFRCLRCDPVTIHVHLMLSLVFRFVLMFVISEHYVLNRENSYRNVDGLCETILLLFLYTTVASVSWMLIQGLYLNVTLLPTVFTGNTRYYLWIYCFIGWVVPAIFVIAYIIAMTSKEQKSCWDGYSEMDEIWILLGPIMIEVVINGIFLLNVVRILLKKVRSSNLRNDFSQIKAAAKATALLFPVLGINNLILLYNPGGEYEKYFVSLNTFFGSTQGIFVSIVYCFIDKEVHAAICRYWGRVNTRRNFYHGVSSTQRNAQATVQFQMQEMGSRPQNGASVPNSLEQAV